MVSNDVHYRTYYRCNIQFVSSNINDDDAEAEASTSTSKSKIIVYVTLYERLSSGCILGEIVSVFGPDLPTVPQLCPVVTVNVDDDEHRCYICSGAHLPHNVQ
ncbi:hypothetical protein BLOT_006733, partial [Blomia tropicalis]